MYKLVIWYDISNSLTKEFNSLVSVYDYITSELGTIRLMESSENLWGVEQLLQDDQWYTNLFWTVEKVEDNI